MKPLFAACAVAALGLPAQPAAAFGVSFDLPVLSFPAPAETGSTRACATAPTKCEKTAG